jgi:hypothetical protein
MMDRENPARDILLRSYWESAGRRVQVLSTGGGHVRYWDGCAAEILHHSQFRTRFKPVYDRNAMRSQFSMSLCNLEEFHAFFSPSVRRFFARCVSRSPEQSFAPSRGASALPKDSIFVGTYAKAFSPADFLDDIDAIVEKVLGAGTSRA